MLDDSFAISEITSPTSFKLYNYFSVLNASDFNVNISGLVINLLNITTNSVILSVNGTQQEIIEDNWTNANGTTISVIDIDTCSFSVTSAPQPSQIIPSSSSSSQYKKHFNLIQGGKNILVQISRQNLAVTELEAVLAHDVSDVDLEITRLSQLPSSVPLPVSRQDVYQYFEIEFDDLDASDFVTSNIEFKVRESWIDNHGFNNERHVKLFTYHNGWIPLDTTLSLRDSTYVYYTTVTQGFSLFAIALSDDVDQPVVPVEEIPPNPCGNGVLDPGETCASCPLDFICPAGYFCQNSACTRITPAQPTLPPPPSQPVTETPRWRSLLGDYSLYIGFVVAILILVVVLVIFLRMRKKFPSFLRTKN